MSNFDEKLIDSVRGYSHLWNIRLPDFKDSGIKDIRENLFLAMLPILTIFVASIADFCDLQDC